MNQLRDAVDRLQSNCSYISFLVRIESLFRMTPDFLGVKLLFSSLCVSVSLSLFISLLPHPTRTSFGGAIAPFASKYTWGNNLSHKDQI